MKTKISAYQLFCITILIPNNTMLFFIAPEAKQDASPTFVLGCINSFNSSWICCVSWH